MGACNFFDMEFGKGVREAFNLATHRARYEYGHGGYTGTIAEKSDYVLVARPKRVTALEVINTLDLGYWGSPATNTAYMERDAKREKREKGAYSNLVKWFGRDAESLLRVYHDKWGPCIAIEASEAESIDFKRRMGIGVQVSWANGVQTVTKKRVHGKVYVFAGWASS